MLVFTEKCLNITMINGLKKYNPTSAGITHNLQSAKITNKREINSQSYPSFTQESNPYTHVKGRKTETYTIDGVLCKVIDVTSFLAGFTARNVNTLYNVFLPCSIITCTDNTDHPEIPLGTEWIVETFTITRSSQRRSVILFNLVISRYLPAVI
jgi:hypothetical protein